MEFDYAPYYCEENVYRMAGALAAAGQLPGDAAAVFIANAGLSCAFAEQRAAPPGEALLWDYHVVLLTGGTGGPDRDWKNASPTRATLWDLDTRLDFPCPADLYLARTFPEPLPEAYRPRFRAVPASRLLREFSSDRRHMRGADGAWLQTPPAWPEVRGDAARSSHELERILNLDNPAWGPILDLAEFRSVYLGL